MFSGEAFDVLEMVPEANFDLLTRSAEGSILPVSAGFLCVNQVILFFKEKTLMISTCNDLLDNHSFPRSPSLKVLIWSVYMGHK